MWPVWYSPQCGHKGVIKLRLMSVCGEVHTDSTPGGRTARISSTPRPGGGPHATLRTPGEHSKQVVPDLNDQFWWSVPLCPLCPPLLLRRGSLACKCSYLGRRLCNVCTERAWTFLDFEPREHIIARLLTVFSL